MRVVSPLRGRTDFTQRHPGRALSPELEKEEPGLRRAERLLLGYVTSDARGWAGPHFTTRRSTEPESRV